MKAVWTEKDLQPGLMVTRAAEDGKYYLPSIIGYFPCPEKGNIYGLTDMRDGMFIRYGDGSREALLKELNEQGFVPVYKIVFPGLGDTSPIENRLGLPAVIFTNSGH